MTLYHYTCRCAQRRLTDRGFLRPSGGVVLGGVDLVWLTDLDTPDRGALGLTSNRLSCDRLTFQYVVDVPDAVAAGHVRRWTDSAVRTWLGGRLNFSDFERAPCQPASWWIADVPVFAIRNRAYRNPDPLPAGHRAFLRDVDHARGAR